MSGSRGGRSILAYIWNNFKSSISNSPLKREGKLMGTDYFGNKYFERPAQPQIGKRRPERWFEHAENPDENFDKELTAEWESWLRHRRYSSIHFIQFRNKKIIILFF